MIVALAGELDAVAFAFMRDRQDNEFLHRHPLAALAGETQAKLLDDEMIGLVEVAPGERFAGPVRGWRANGCAKLSPPRFSWRP